MLIFSEHRRNNLSGGNDLRVAKQKPLQQKKEIKPVPKTHLNSYVASFRKFLSTAGIDFLDESDFKLLDIDAKSWGSTHQCPRKQAAEIHVSVLKAWGDLVSDSKRRIAGRLFAWPFRVAAAAGLRWE